MSKIEWTNKTWNPIVGCSKCSPGCDNCYAEKMANRLACMSVKDDRSEMFRVDSKGKYAMVTNNGKWNGKTFFSEIDLNKPYQWKKPRMIFVCSMGDLFHESVPFEWVNQVMAIIAICQQHTFQILTKRPERMKQYFAPIGGTTRRDWVASKMARKLNVSTLKFPDWPLPNLWLGVTAENQVMADKRIPILLQIPAAIRFVSVEPMLGPVDIHPHGLSPDRPLLDWVICGGETGHNARPIHCIWVQALKEQCRLANVPFFFKSWGGKNKSNHRIDGIEYHQFPISKSSNQ